MMNLIKKADRIMNIHMFREAMKATNTNLEEIATYCKWKEVSTGRLQVKFTIYKLTDKDGNVNYTVTDSLNRIACTVTNSITDITDFFSTNGYMPEKDWYINEYGMTEESWNEWNNA